MTQARSLSLEVAGGSVSALLLRPRDARALLVLGHGAGAGMRHIFMEEMAELLGERGIATFRYQFPYMEAGRRYPNPQRILTATVRRAVAAAHEAAPDLPLFAGGKSMGGRMTLAGRGGRPARGRARDRLFWASPCTVSASRPASSGASISTGSSCPSCSSKARATGWPHLDFLCPGGGSAGTPRERSTWSRAGTTRSRCSREAGASTRR